jgi:phosphocarrier protein
VRLGSRAADGKSIMGVMMLGARMGTSIDVEIDGEDEAAMLEALSALLANRFGEGE